MNNNIIPTTTIIEAKLFSNSQTNLERMVKFVCPYCGADPMTYVQLQSHCAFEHSLNLPPRFRCPNCDLHCETSDLLKEHLSETGHSVAEDVRMVLVWTRLSTSIASAGDLRDLVETLQSRKANSEEADILAACANRILTACETAEIPVELTGTLPLPIDQTGVQSEPSEMEKFFDEVMKIDFDQDPVEWFLRAIDYLLGMICGQNELTLVARRSSVQLLVAILCKSDGIAKRNLIGERPFLENVCESIQIQLNKPDYEDTLAISWECISYSSGLSFDTEKRFLDADGLSLFLLCYQKFGNQAELVHQMMSWMLGLSGEKSFRQGVLADGTFGIFWEIWIKTESDRLSLSYAQFFCDFLADSSLSWPLGPYLTPVEVEENLISLMLRLTKSDSFCAQVKIDYEFRYILEFLWKLWGDTKVLQTRHFCSRIFSVCLSIEPTNWPLDYPTIDDVKWRLWKKKWQKTSANGEGVELTMSSLIDRFGTTLAAQLLLPDVILLMRIQLDNIKDLMGCHWLINLYSSDQLKQLETPLRRCLLEDLLVVVKHHHHLHHSIVVENFCDLMGKIFVDQCDIDSYPEAIDSLLVIVCDVDNLSLTARKSVLTLMEIFTGKSADFDDVEEHLTRPPLVEKVCRSIRVQLDTCEFDELMVSWKSLNFLCCFSVESRKKFLDAGGLQLFKESYEKFGNQVELVVQMTGLMKCLAMLSFRPVLMAILMTDGMLAIFWEIWGDVQVNVSIRHDCGQIVQAIQGRNEVELNFVSLMLELFKSELLTSRRDLITSWQSTKW